jgi:hypothetical protein
MQLARRGAQEGALSLEKNKKNGIGCAHRTTGGDPPQIKSSVFESFADIAHTALLAQLSAPLTQKTTQRSHDCCVGAASGRQQ